MSGMEGGHEEKHFQKAAPKGHLWALHKHLSSELWNYDGKTRGICFHRFQWLPVEAPHLTRNKEEEGNKERKAKKEVERARRRKVFLKIKQKKKKRKNKREMEQNER